MATNTTAPAFDPNAAYAPAANATGTVPAFDPNAAYQPAQAASSKPPSTGHAVVDAGLGVLSGIGGGVMDTLEGAKNLANKVLPDSAQIPDIPAEYRTPRNASEKVGNLLEGIGEFAAGDEALEGAAKASKLVALAQKYPLVAKTLTLATEHPWLAKIIVEGTKGATVGAAQGAVKGSAEGNAVSGAEGGAIGGGIGGAIGGGVEAAAAKADPIGALTQAIKPTGNLAKDFAAKAELALPRLADEHANTPITNLDELSDAAHNAAQNLWGNEIVPQIQKHGAETISGKPVADAIRNGVSAGDKDLFPEAADAADTFAKKFDSDMTLQQASDRLQSLNRKLSTLYKMDPASRYTATANSPTLDAMEDGANELRQQIYTKLEALGEDDPAGLRKTYGALKTVEQAAEKRAIVVGRAAPLNLAQQLASAASALHIVGHLAAGDIPGAAAGAAPVIAAKATKVLNSPEHLIGSALNEETGGAVGALARKAATATANLGAQAGQAVANETDEQ